MACIPYMSGLFFLRGIEGPEMRAVICRFTFITVRNEGNVLHLSVILSTGGVSLSACWDTPPHPLPRVDTCPRQTPPGQTLHPGGHYSGWYASYWNAFLFKLITRVYSLEDFTKVT